MKIYRAKIRPKTSFITPLHSDSIFGALCWTIQKSEGTEALKQILNLFLKQDPPFIVSNGFPGDFMPRPFVPPKPEGLEDKSKEQLLEEVSEGKRIKKTKYLTLEEFKTIIWNGTSEISTKIKPYIDVPVVHNSINRWSGTTLESGGLHSAVERFSNVNYWSIYIKAKEEWYDKLKKWISILGEIGFGKRKSVGKGHFVLLEFTQVDFFSNLETSNAFVVLSNFVPSTKDPTRGFYKTFVKYGKLDGEFATGGNPFKTPILMIVPGSVFLTDDVNEYYGRMVTKVSSGDTDIVHYGYGFSVPAKVSTGL